MECGKSTYLRDSIAYDALHNLGTFSFIVLRLFVAYGKLLAMVVYLLYLIENIEDNHKEAIQVIS